MSRTTQSKLQFKSSKKTNNDNNQQLLNNKASLTDHNNNSRHIIIDSEPTKSVISSTIKLESTSPNTYNSIQSVSPNKRVTRQTSLTKSTEKTDDKTTVNNNTKSTPKSSSSSPPAYIIDLHNSDTREASNILPGTWDDASTDEILLRKFDLDMKYGPCGGLSRRERWNRANDLGLKPPQKILEILDAHQETRAPEADEQDSENHNNFNKNNGNNQSPHKKQRSNSKTKIINSFEPVSSHSIFENPAARVLEFENRS